MLLLIGHVTKEGSLAGPRVLEHLVDVVLTFEGDRANAFRLLRAAKNRFGSTQEIGVLNMASHGLEAVENPSELFLEERSTRAPGSCVIPLLEGSRPMLVELQALVAPAPYGTPRRTTLGLEDARVALLLAVLDRRSPVDILSQDVYAKAAGGVRVAEPAADLGIASRSRRVASTRRCATLPLSARSGSAERSVGSPGSTSGSPKRRSSVSSGSWFLPSATRSSVRGPRGAGRPRTPYANSFP